MLFIVVEYLFSSVLMILHDVLIIMYRHSH